MFVTLPTEKLSLEQVEASSVKEICGEKKASFPMFPFAQYVETKLTWSYGSLLFFSFDKVLF